MTIIKIDNLSKKYIIGHDKNATGAFRYKSLRESLSHTARGMYQRIIHPLSTNTENTYVEEFWALKDINFEVKQGDRVGIIGRNGAGKSTLLKILSSITVPSSGRIIIEGRIASLLEVGTGFHPELTGRENIYLNGAILGMSRQDVRRKFDEIVDFSGVEQFLDTPVKRYSSGMHVRLGFAVAAHLEPEVLVVDEVLAVGDASFQKKCISKMGEVAKEGRTILFVSHQMQAVSTLCNKAILLDHGMVVREGSTDEVINSYLNEKSTCKIVALKDRKDRRGNGKLRLVETWVEDKNNNRVTNVILGETVSICARYEIHEGKSFKGMIIGCAINSLQNVQITDLSNRATGEEFYTPMPSVGIIKCVIKKLPLNKGIYTYNIIAREHNDDILDYIVEAGRFDVTEGDYFGTGRIADSGSYRLIMMDHNWNISSADIKVAEMSDSK